MGANSVSGLRPSWLLTPDQLQIQHYGRDRTVGCELLPSRYDRIVEAIGGHGEHVERPEDLGPAIARAIGSGRPACVNVTIEGVAAPTF